MINRVLLDRLDDAIDQFEDQWSAESKLEIGSLLTGFQLSDDVESIAELIRIDIDLRYENELPVNLDDYLETFPTLWDHPEYLSEIAFEDFRSRLAAGHQVSPGRWRHLPAIGRHQWYRQLMRDTEGSQESKLSKQRNSSKQPLGEGLIHDPVVTAAFAEAGFQLIEKINEGAFSEVYLAREKDLSNRYVILKIVEETLGEPDRMASLQHTNIVPVFSSKKIGDRFAICMPYTGSVTMADYMNHGNATARDGESLVATVRQQMDVMQTVYQQNEPIDSTRFDSEKQRLLQSQESASAWDTSSQLLNQFQSLDRDQLAVCLFLRLSDAIAHSHARGILHNDLKPSNVLIRNDGEPALLDFNLSQDLYTDPTPRVGGTLPYMAPEVYRAMMGQKVTPGVTADLYSLGVMLFQFLAGRFPFPVPASQATADLHQAHNARKAAPDWKTEDRVSPGLKSIVNRCLAFEQDQRYQSGEQIHEDLQREQNHQSLRYASEPRIRKAGKYFRRNQKTLLATSAVTILLPALILASIAAFQWRTHSMVVAATSELQDFSDQSAETLTRLAADPERRSQASITNAIQPLVDFEFLDGKGFERLQWVKDPKTERAAAEDIRRHIVHIAFFEADRLERLKRQNAFDDTQIQRFDQLIESMRKAQRGDESRSSLFLQAKRASLLGESELSSRRNEEAEEFILANDDDRYLEAIRLLADHRYPEAREQLTLISDQNDVPSALRWTILGRAHYVQGEYEAAKLCFTQSIARASASANLYVLRGMCFFKLHKGAEAIKDYQAAIDLEGDHYEAWYNLGVVSLGVKDWNKAISHFTQAIEHGPDRLNAYLKRAKAYRESDRADLAEIDFQRAIQTKSVDADSLVARSHARADVDANEALADLEMAIRLRPESSQILMQKARLLAINLKQEEAAVEVYGQVLEREPSNEIARIDRAVLMARLGRVEEAIEEAKCVLDDSSSARNLFQAGCVFARSNSEQHQKRAVMLITRSILNGYRPVQLQSDEDLQSLEGRSGFEAICRAYDITR